MLGNSPSAKRLQSGVGLIEIMIAIIILSIGFLAAGRMQAQGIRAAQEGFVRSQAHFLLKDMADRMRSNPSGAAAGFYGQVHTQNGAYTPANCASQTNNPTPCTPAMIAQNDLAEWSGYINPDNAATTALLPSGESVNAFGQIALSNDVYTIQVTWSQTINGVEEAQIMSTVFIP